MQAEADDLVKVELLPAHNYALSGVLNKVDVLVKLRTGPLATSEASKPRMPLNLAIVLDRSGSMQGSKLDNATAAITGLIESLREDDVLHLVCYDSQVDTIFENASISQRDALRAKVNSIQAGSYTNLWAGLERGAELLVRHAKAGYCPRVFLFSDGLVNEGVQDKGRILNKVANELYGPHGIQVSTFGLGSDFDEELMTAIAERGGHGAFFFIEGANAIPNFVSFALNFTQNVVAMEAVLRVQGVHSGLVRKVYGQKDQGQALTGGVRLGDLRADNVRSLVLEMEVSPKGRRKEGESGDEKEDEEVLHCQLIFKTEDPITGEPVERSIGQTMKIGFTDEHERVENSKNVEVHAQAVIQQTAEIDKQLHHLMGAGGASLSHKERRDQCIALYERALELLEGIVEVDDAQLGGQLGVESLLKRTRSAVEELRHSGVTRTSKLRAYSSDYSKSRGDRSYSSMYF
ncbi:VWFA domain-containing protein [Balamuthia mandrillaris]